MRTSEGPARSQMPYIHIPLLSSWDPAQYICHSSFKSKESKAWARMIMCFKSKDYYFYRTFLGSKSPVPSTSTGHLVLMSTKLPHVSIQPPHHKCSNRAHILLMDTQTRPSHPPELFPKAGKGNQKMERVIYSLSRKKKILPLFIDWSLLLGESHCYDLIQVWTYSPFLGTLGKTCFIVFSFWYFERQVINPLFALISSILTWTTRAIHILCPVNTLPATTVYTKMICFCLSFFHTTLRSLWAQGCSFFLSVSLSFRSWYVASDILNSIEL